MKDDRQICVSIGLHPGEAQGAWKPHPYNFVTQKLFLIAQFGTNFKFRGCGSINKIYTIQLESNLVEVSPSHNVAAHKISLITIMHRGTPTLCSGFL